MREIIFRGKRTDNGEWAEGYLTKRPSSIQYGAHYSPWFIDTPPKDPDDSGDYCNVTKETVGQYTGLTDKNGKKIFEGDIVKYGDTVHKVVFEQRNGTAYFGLVYSPLETLPFGHYQDLRQIEVIGNIHDNPELLKGGE